MAHEPGSLSWAIDKARLGAIDVYLGPYAAYWNVETGYFCWRSSDSSPVGITTVNLAGWTIEAPAPETEGCPNCGGGRMTECIQPPAIWTCEQCGYRDKTVWSEGKRSITCLDSGEPQTEDVSIEDFRLWRRQARLNSATAETQFEAHVQCWLYLKESGGEGFEELNAPNMWYGRSVNPEGSRIYLVNKPTGGEWEGDWTQPTHVRLYKETK